ncbi:MAG: hypothetical protein KDA75_21795, partial [Planctomycetaceae bacterium]|nr:hypothetical protein [Planctomycetaceae bacterium]
MTRRTTQLRAFAWLAAVVLGSPALHAQWGTPAGYGGHSMTGSGVQLLGIEPFGSSPGSAGVWRRPEDNGRAMQVQYPLDNQAYSDPFSQSPGGYPLYAPGAEGRSYSPSAPSSGLPAAQDDGWVQLGTSTWESTWVAGGSANDALGLFTNEIRTKIEFPVAPMFAVSPRFGWHLLDGPIATD